MVYGFERTNPFLVKPREGGWDKKSILIVTIVSHRAISSHDSRNAIGHGLGNRQGKSFAAEWMDQTITARVKVGYLGLGEFFIQILDLGCTGIGLYFSDLLVCRFALIKGARTHVLDDQADVVGSCKRLSIRLK